MMFGTEIHLITFTFITIQVMILIPALKSLFESIKDKERQRFLLVILMFLLFNIFCGLFPDENISINKLAQNIISWTIGLICFIYFLYFIYRDFDIKIYRFITLSVVSRVLTFSFISLFIIPYTITYNLKFSRNIFLIIPLIIGISALINVIHYSFKDYKKENNQYYKLRKIFGIVAVLSLFSLPLNILIFGDNQSIQHLSFNIGFLAVLSSYYIKKKNISHFNKIVEENDNISKTKLNNKEKEILFLLLSNTNLPLEQLIKNYFKNNSFLDIRKEQIFETNQQKNKLVKDINNLLVQYNLSERELEITELILKNYKYKEIANKLFINEKTVSKHASNIFKKTDVSNKKELKQKLLHNNSLK